MTVVGRLILSVLDRITVLTVVTRVLSPVQNVGNILTPNEKEKSMKTIVKNQKYPLGSVLDVARRSILNVHGTSIERIVMRSATQDTHVRSVNKCLTSSRRWNNTEKIATKDGKKHTPVHIVAKNLFINEKCKGMSLVVSNFGIS
jgi:hypothetical protein